MTARTAPLYDLYQCNRDDSARFIIGKSGRRKLFVMGLNPSTANREKADMTIAKAERIARRNGFDGFVVANLYPLRCTMPGNLPTKADKALYRENLRRIRAAVRAETDPVIWAAWGGDITTRGYFIDALKALCTGRHALPGKWVQYGTLRKDGHPRHPSRAAYAWTFSSFDVAGYLRKLDGAGRATRSRS